MRGVTVMRKLTPPAVWTCYVRARLTKAPRCRGQRGTPQVADNALTPGLQACCECLQLATQPAHMHGTGAGCWPRSLPDVLLEAEDEHHNSLTVALVPVAEQQDHSTLT